jgi:pyruvate-formate lyase-activating enzyme
VRDLLAEIRRVAPYLSGVTVSGGECTLQTPFVRSLFWWIKADPHLAHLTTLVDSNGDAPGRAWDSLRRVMDGAMIDLKALDPVQHRILTGHGNERVLASLHHLHAIDRLHEVRLLLVPGYNDDPAQLEATGRWLRDLDPTVPVKLQGFSRHGVRPAFRSLPEPTADELSAHAALLAGAGLERITVAA